MIWLDSWDTILKKKWIHCVQLCDKRENWRQIYTLNHLSETLKQLFKYNCRRPNLAFHFYEIDFFNWICKNKPKQLKWILKFDVDQWSWIWTRKWLNLKVGRHIFNKNWEKNKAYCVPSKYSQFRWMGITKIATFYISDLH